MNAPQKSPQKEDLLAQAAGQRMPAPSSEATQIEAQRAIAQVQGALIVARSNPREVDQARDRIRRACEVHELAIAAFFAYDRGGQKVIGPSIKLARELARCWGNVDYSMVELRRDDDKGESEMLAVAWDLETNTRSSNSFIVPHKRDKRGGAVKLTDLRDIYENNANAAARRLRECILSVIPHEIVEEAKALCRKTIEHGQGLPMPERRKLCLEAFAKLGVTQAQLEKRIGRTMALATPQDLAALQVIEHSIRNNEATVPECFEDDSRPQLEADLKKNREAAAPADDQEAKLLAESREVASLGRERLNQFWKGLSQPQRKIVNTIMEELKRTAIRADEDAAAAERGGDDAGESLFPGDAEVPFPGDTQAAQ
jgi:hypothetical protein